MSVFCPQPSAENPGDLAMRARSLGPRCQPRLPASQDIDGDERVDCVDHVAIRAFLLDRNQSIEGACCHGSPSWKRKMRPPFSPNTASCRRARRTGWRGEVASAEPIVAYSVLEFNAISDSLGLYSPKSGGLRGANRHPPERMSFRFGSFATEFAEAIRPCASAAPEKQTRTY